MCDGKPSIRVNDGEKGCRRIVLHRPERLNALSFDLVSELGRALDDATRSEDVRLVVITGAGERAFSAGADLKERREMSDADIRCYLDLLGNVLLRLERLPRPTIARLNGIALGGGAELALCCDFRVAVRGAQIGLPEVRLGIIPGAGGTQRLARLIGPSRAKELIFTGKPVTAERAQTIGLVDRLAAPGELDDCVGNLANELADSAPLAISRAKEAIALGLERPLSEGLQLERECYETLLGTSDRREGIVAFAEKRHPCFRGC